MERNRYFSIIPLTLGRWALAQLAALVNSHYQSGFGVSIKMMNKNREQQRHDAVPLPHPFRMAGTDENPNVRTSGKGKRPLIVLPAASQDCALCQATVDRQLRDIDAKVVHEAQIADALQQSILPASIPQTVGLDVAVAYKAVADEALIGGDFYDVFEIDAGRTAIVVGDVCGKGLKAAAQIASFRSMLRYALYTNRVLPQALTELNKVLNDHALVADFVTVFVAVYSSKSKKLEYASCGHEPAMIVRHGKQPAIELLRPTGPVLGLRVGSSIKSAVCELGTGDSLVVYTDGLVECGPYKCELLSVARLIRVIRDRCAGATAEEVARLVFADALAHAGQHFSDDVCLVVGQATTVPPRRAVKGA